MLSIDPTAPVSGGALTCLITGSDTDTDTLSHAIAWSVSGTDFTDTQTTTWPDDTVPEDTTLLGDAWTCSVTSFDGTEDGPEASVTITIDHEPLSSTPGAEDAVAVFIGEERATSYYQSFAFTGDFDYNDDGTPDILIGSTSHDTKYTDPGAAFVFFGPVTGEHALSDGDLMFSPNEAQAYAGSEVSAGDIDDDGIDELLISAEGGDVVYLIDDGLSGTVDEDSTGVTAFADYRYAHILGDIDDDGIVDALLASSFGSDADIYLGSSSGLVAEGSSVTVLGTDMVGGAVGVSDGGVDLDGDGAMEWAVVGSGGIIAVLSGTTTLSEIAALYNYTAAVTIVRLADDLNGDGYGDLLAANYTQAVDDKFKGTVSDYGTIWFFPGSASGVTATDATDADWTIIGSDDHEYVGIDLDFSDIDSDGSLDVMIGRYSNPPVLFYGPLGSGTFDETDGDVSFEATIDGVARAGDINSDGINDLLVGSLEDNIYLYLGAGR